MRATILKPISCVLCSGWQGTRKNFWIFLKFSGVQRRPHFFAGIHRHLLPSRTPLLHHHRRCGTVGTGRNRFASCGFHSHSGKIRQTARRTGTVRLPMWAGLSIGDQDHGSGSNGFEIYFPNGIKIGSLEYKGTGDPTDTLNYVLTDSLFSLLQVFKSTGGAITDVMTYPGMDLNNNGLREVVVNFKPGTGTGIDTLWSGKPLKKGTYAFFVLEWGDISVSVEFPNIVPDQFSLDQNYPNPFNPSTTIKFHVPSQSPVTIKIFDIVGREIRTLIGGTPYKAGNHEVVWDGKDNAGATVSTGTYFYRMDADKFSVTRKMMVLK